MIAFWIAAVVVTLACVGLVLVFASRPVAASADPEKGVYRRQLSEIDDLAGRGLLGEDERKSAYAEAARRLLGAKDAQGEAGPTKTSKLVISVIAAGIGVIAMALYLAIGSPGLPAKPYKARLAEWAANPTQLQPEQMAAVLEDMSRKRPADMQVLNYLARAQIEAGDGPGAVRTLQKLLAANPNRAELWLMLGQVQLAQRQGDDIPPDAIVSMRRALAIDPTLTMPRYVLARADIAAGKVDQGLAVWRALAADMPEEGKPMLEREIRFVEQQGRLPGAGAQGGADPAIRAMVDGLAARLEANPDDPQGWARLIRSYAVLKDEANRATALAKARAYFKDRPNDLALIEANSEINPQSR